MKKTKNSKIFSRGPLWTLVATRNREKKRFRWPRGVQGTPGSIPRKSSLDPGAVLDRKRVPKGSLRAPLGVPWAPFGCPGGPFWRQKLDKTSFRRIFSAAHDFSSNFHRFRDNFPANFETISDTKYSNIYVQKILFFPEVWENV